MSETDDRAESKRETANANPTLEPDEKRWLEAYVNRLRNEPGALLKRVVLYGSKARGDAGPESDVDVLVLVESTQGAVRKAEELVWHDDDPYDVDHSVLVRLESHWLQDLDKELPFPRNVEAEGVQIHPVHQGARRAPGDRPPVTSKGIRHAVPVWLKQARNELTALQRHIEYLEDERIAQAGIAARSAFDAVFFSVMAWCLGRGVSVVRRKDLPATVERHLIDGGVLDASWAERIQRLWEAWNCEVDWHPERDTQPTVDDAIQWARTARDFHELARRAVAATGIDLDAADDTTQPTSSTQARQTDRTRS